MGKDKDNVTIDHVEVVPAEKKRGSEFYFEIALILVLGFLIGMVVKTEAVKKITMGYEDYHITPNVQAYNFKALEDEIMNKYQEQMDAATAPIEEVEVGEEEPAEEE